MYHPIAHISMEITRTDGEELGRSTDRRAASMADLVRIGTEWEGGRLLDMQEVPGSSPVSPTRKKSRSRSGFFECRMTAKDPRVRYLTEIRLQWDYIL